MPTIVGILIFITRKNFMLNWVEYEKKFYNLEPWWWYLPYWLLVVWSKWGPVDAEEVPFRFLVQSNWSLLAWTQSQRSASKSQESKIKHCHHMKISFHKLQNIILSIQTIFLTKQTNEMMNFKVINSEKFSIISQFQTRFYRCKFQWVLILSQEVNTSRTSFSKLKVLVHPNSFSYNAVLRHG